MKKAIIISPSQDVKVKELSEKDVERLFRAAGLITMEEFASRFPLVYRLFRSAIGDIIGGIKKLPKLAFHAVAPPEGQTWKDIVEAVKEGKSFSLKIWIAGVSPFMSIKEELGRAAPSYFIPVAVSEVTFEPTNRTIKVGEKEVRQFNAVFAPSEIYALPVEYAEYPTKKKRGDILTPEEAEELMEELLEEEEVSLEELQEKKERAEREEREKEKEEWIEDAISRIGGSKKLLKHVLLAKVAALVRESTALTLQKAEKKRARTT
jgi:hypothetical protein